jgi:hypothetical protein
MTEDDKRSIEMELLDFFREFSKSFGHGKFDSKDGYDFSEFFNSFEKYLKLKSSESYIFFYAGDESDTSMCNISLIKVLDSLSMISVRLKFLYDKGKTEIGCLLNDRNRVTHDRGRHDIESFFQKLKSRPYYSKLMTFCFNKYYYSIEFCHGVTAVAYMMNGEVKFV